MSTAPAVWRLPLLLVGLLSLLSLSLPLPTASAQGLQTPEEYLKQIETAKSRAAQFLYSKQRNTVRVVRIENQNMLVEDVPAGAISVNGNTARVGARAFANVFAVLPPGWFDPDPLGEVDWSNAGGSTALITLALLAAGQDPDKEPRLAAALKCLDGAYTADMGGQVLKNVAGKRLAPGLQGTYAVGIHACIHEHLALHGTNAARKNASRKTLTALAKRVETGFRPDGGYDYFLKGSDRWDLSNTQYAMLALWSAHNVTREVSERTLSHLNNFYLKCQTVDGGFPYKENDASSVNMTAGAVASLMILLDTLHANKRDRPDAEPFKPDTPAGKTVVAAAKGLEWFANNYKSSPNGYLLYSAERIGMASGYKRFGISDWYRDGVEVLLKSQKQDGSWEPPPALGYAVDVNLNTAFCLLFIAHGSAPVLVSKLRWGPENSFAWNHYPRDAAGLTRWFNRNFEQEASWQVVDFKATEDWRDAPILYIAGVEPPNLEANELDELREYLDQGGTLLAVACGNPKTTAAFTTGIRDIIARLYPPNDYPDRGLGSLAKTHPLFAAGSAKGLEKLKISHVHDGSRSLIFLVHEDISFAWNNGRDAKREYMFEFFSNLKNYVTDKALVLPPKLKPRPPEIDDPDALPPFHIAAIQYTSTGSVSLTTEDGKPITANTVSDWNAVPGAWKSLNPYFMALTKVRIDDRRPVSLTDPNLRGFPMLHLAGRHPFKIEDREKLGIRQFVEYGGVILVEDLGVDPNKRAFRDAAVANFKAIFPQAEIKPLPDNHPIFAGGLPGSAGAIKLAEYSRSVKVAKPLLTTPDLDAIWIGGRPAVILSQYDISTGLTGGVYWGRFGYQTKSARMLAINLVAWIRSERQKAGK